MVPVHMHDPDSRFLWLERVTALLDNRSVRTDIGYILCMIVLKHALANADAVAMFRERGMDVDRYASELETFKLVAANIMRKGWAVPPGVPVERVEAVRSALDVFVQA